MLANKHRCWTSVEGILQEAMCTLVYATKGCKKERQIYFKETGRLFNPFKVLPSFFEIESTKPHVESANADHLL